MATKYEYEIKYGLVRITNVISDDKKIVVPSKIDGKNVYQICKHSFMSLPVTDIILPKTIGKIEDASFVDLNELAYFECHHFDTFSKPFSMDMSKVSIFSYSSTVASFLDYNYPELKSIEYYKDFKYEVIDELKKTARIVGFNMRKHSIIFPSFIDGYKIVELSSRVNHYDALYLKKIIFPKYLTNIPDRFLENAKEPIDVVFPDRLKEIGDRAFYNTFLKDGTVLPKSLKHIGNEAFYYDKLPFDIGILYFKGNKHLLLENSCFEGRNVSFAKDVYLDFNGFYIFRKSNIFDITLHSLNEIIPIGTFCNSNIYNISGLSFIKNLNRYAFYKAYLKNVKSFNLENVVYVEDDVFSFCNIKEFYIPKNLELSSSLFKGSDVEKVIFAKDYSFDSIPYECFAHTKKFKSIRLPESITKLGTHSFYASGLRKINLKNINVLDNLALSMTHIVSVNLSNVKYIFERVFMDCKELVRVYFGNSTINHIDDFVFWGCSSLQKLKLPKTVRTLGKGTFGSTSIVKIDLSNIEEMGDMCFYDGSVIYANLKNIRIIGERCFEENKFLTRVDFSDFIEVIPRRAFYKCINLDIVNFGKIKRIEEFAFFICMIKVLNLPETIEMIEPYAIDELRTEKFIFRGKNIGKMSLVGLENLKELIIDTNSPTGMFVHYEHLEKIIFTKNCEKIEASSVYNNENLKYVCIKNKKCIISKRNFVKCDKLEEIYMDNDTEFEKLKKRPGNKIKKRFDSKDFKY